MNKDNYRSFAIIIAVSLFGTYSMLPNLFFYWKKLNCPITNEDAKKEISLIVEREKIAQDFSIDWINNYAKHLSISLKSIQEDPNSSRLIHIKFHSIQDSERFHEHIYRAGSLITKPGCKLSCFSDNAGNEESDSVTKEAIISREPSFFLKDNTSSFSFLEKFDQENRLTESYKNLIEHRSKKLKDTLCSNASNMLSKLHHILYHPQNLDPVIQVAEQVQILTSSLEYTPNVIQRLANWLVGNNKNTKEQLKSAIRSGIQWSKDKIKRDISEQNKDLSEVEKEHLQKQLKEKLASVERLVLFLDKADFKKSQEDIDADKLYHPLFENVHIDWSKEKINIVIASDLQGILEENTSKSAASKDWIFSEINQLREALGEKFTPYKDGFFVKFDQNPSTSSIIFLNLVPLLQAEKTQVADLILNSWNPVTPALSQKEFPCLFSEEYNHTEPQNRRFSLVVFAPNCDKLEDREFLSDNGSVYVLFRGYKELYKRTTETAARKNLNEDLRSLILLLHRQGYTNCTEDNSVAKSFPDALVLQVSSLGKGLLKQTQEKFSILSDIALLEMSTRKQRLHVLHQIEKKEHEALLKWRDDYQAAMSSPNPNTTLLVPPPNGWPIWENLKNNIRKYFRGDPGKVIHWGLDLSGGKSVRIALLDNNDRLVKSADDISRAREELVKRVNRMGLSEVSVRIEKDNLIFDFPGSQDFSAEELIEATSMTFHVINEKFMQKQGKIAYCVNQFLQKIWDEAVISGNTEFRSLNQLAYDHLHGEKRIENDTTKILFDEGLAFAGPEDFEAESALDEHFSIIAPFTMDQSKGELPRKHPLMIMFRNHALRGADISRIQPLYDPMRGYYLNFEVTNKNDTGQNPQDHFAKWTGFYSKEAIAGTPKQIREGNGWRMAVLLDREIISCPELQSKLRTGAAIFGNFSQREANRLAADLKAGSLSFKPKILAEENISPELGTQERRRSLLGFQISLGLVTLIMCAYYRFWGVIASCALLINLLMLFSVLQSTGATLSLAGLAGIVLTLGMAVDSNVLVFERIREELAIGTKLLDAIYIGYKKALAAVVDSSVTTLIACLILVQFDCGPVKGFAVALAIGILVSIFTAVFATKEFFSWFFSKKRSVSVNMNQLFSQDPVPLFKSFSAFCYISGTIFILGISGLWQSQSNLMGVDLIGGNTLSLEFPNGSGDMRTRVTRALLKEGIPSSLFKIQEKGSPEKLRMYLDHTSEQYFENAEGLCDILDRNDIPISFETRRTATSSWASVSGQFSHTMRNNALIALALSLLSVLIYLSIRFEWQYGIAAIVGIVHNLIMTFSVIGILLFFEIPVQIDLQVVGAIMTIIGYCLNDTIIIFDRIREELYKSSNKNLKSTIERAIGSTLGRTCMTCITTLTVLICLLLFTGKSLFSFSLVMTIGVIIGPLSSCFASAILEWLNRYKME